MINMTHIEYEMNGHNSSFLSNQAEKLEYLLQRDDERQRRKAILDIADKNKYSNVQIPSATDIAPMMDNQGSVEEQLQEQVNFYQGALLKLKEKSDEITTENARLYQRMRESVVQNHIVSDSDDHDEVYDEDHSHEDDDEERNEIVNEDVSPKRHFSKKPKERLLRTKNECDADRKQQRLDGGSDDVFFTLKRGINGKNFDHEFLFEEMSKMQQIYETKTKHLSSLLEDMRKQTEEKEEEIMKLKSDKRHSKTHAGHTVELHCSRCATTQNLQPAAVTLEKKMVDRLTRERNDLLECIEKQKQVMKEGNQREVEAYQQVKKSCELVEQAQIEKQEALVQAKQLKKNLDEYMSKYQKLLINFEESQVQKKTHKDMQKNIAILTDKVDEQTDLASVLQVQMEKLTREKVNLEKELEKMKLHIITQKTETASLVEESRKELMEAYKKNTLIQQEAHQRQLDLKKREKQKHMEVDHLLVEAQETKRRLQLSQQDLQKHQDEILRLSKTVNSCSQQLQNEKLQSQLLSQRHEEEIKNLLYEREQREQELTLLLQETSHRYTTTKEELSNLLETQTEIVNKYQEEYKILHDNMFYERKKQQEKITQLVGQCENAEKYIAESSSGEKKKDLMIRNYQQQMEKNEIELNDYKEQVIILMNKQNIILRDRNLLSKEIELLRSQLYTVPSK